METGASRDAPVFILPIGQTKARCDEVAVGGSSPYVERTTTPKSSMTLSAKQLEHLERRLKEERSRALSTLNRSVDEFAGSTDQERSGDLTSMPLHMADVGTDTMQEEIEASNETRISRELADIDDALSRLYKSPDRFGISESTGAPIPFERLDAIPWART